MIDKLLKVALFGGEPILYLLIVLSLISVAVIIERLWVYRNNRVDLPQLASDIVQKLNAGDLEGARNAAAARQTAETRVLREGLDNFEQGAVVAAELMASMRTRQQQHLNRRLIVLGTVGSNAPFVGLLGTVLGIIKAFNDLAFAAKAGPSVVMAGISEALVATAIGLVVAIPAVVFFNYFKHRQQVVMENIAQLESMLLAFLGTNRTDPSTTLSNSPV